MHLQKWRTGSGYQFIKRIVLFWPQEDMTTANKHEWTHTNVVFVKLHYLWKTVLCHEFNRKYTQSVSPVVFIFSSLLHLAPGSTPRSSRCLLFFFFLFPQPTSYSCLINIAVGVVLGQCEGNSRRPTTMQSISACLPLALPCTVSVPTPRSSSFSLGPLVFSQLTFCSCNAKESTSERCFTVIEALLLKTFPSGQSSNIWRHVATAG